MQGSVRISLAIKMLIPTTFYCQNRSHVVLGVGVTDSPAIDIFRINLRPCNPTLFLKCACSRQSPRPYFVSSPPSPSNRPPPLRMAYFSLISRSTNSFFLSIGAPVRVFQRSSHKLPTSICSRPKSNGQFAIIKTSIAPRS